jgi:hypothetical protein
MPAVELLARMIDAPDLPHDWVVVYRAAQGQPQVITDLDDLRAVVRMAQHEHWSAAHLSRIVRMSHDASKMMLATTDLTDIVHLPGDRSERWVER